MTDSGHGGSPPVYRKRPKPPGMDESMYHVLVWIDVLNHLGRTIRHWGPGDGVQDGVVDQDVFTPHEMTYLKLQIVGTYAREFLELATRHTDQVYYLDVLSATGLSYARGWEASPVPGSCFAMPLAWQDFERPDEHPRYEFTRAWLFESKPGALDLVKTRHEALARLAGLALPAFAYMEGDANERVIEAVEEIEALTKAAPGIGGKRPLTMAFVDNQGLNVRMDTIRAIQERIRADLVVHIPTSAAWRTVQAFRTTGQNKALLDRFFGSERWMELDGPEDVPRFYHEAIREATGQELQNMDPLPIRGDKHSFHIGVYARQTRGTRGREGWVATLKRRAEACNRLDSGKIRGFLAQGTGSQAGLFDY